MKKVIIAALSMLTVFLTSCDDRLEFIADVNRPPEISLTRNGEMLQSLDVDFKMKDEIKGPGEEVFPFEIFIEDPEGFDGTIEITIISGAGVLLNSDMVEITSGLAYVNKTSKTIYFDPLDNDGTTQIRLTAIDNLGKTNSVELTVNSFLNKVPTAAWAYTNIKLNDPYEYELDASSSVDGDQDLGGAIQGYEWNVNGNVFIVEDAKIPYVFSKASTNGTTYSVKLRVIDNNGVYSAIVEKFISVN
jgi:hypothetical protein